MIRILHILKQTDQRQTVHKPITEARRWEALGGPNEHLARYEIITGDYFEEYPRSIEADTQMRSRMTDIYKEQAFLACRQIEILISMTYLQKARIESNVASDNWARDAQGVIEAQIKRLIRAHKTIRQTYDGYHY